MLLRCIIVIVSIKIKCPRLVDEINVTYIFNISKFDTDEFRWQRREEREENRDGPPFLSLSLHLALRAASHSYIHKSSPALFAPRMKDRASMVKRASPDLLMDSALWFHLLLFFLLSLSLSFLFYLFFFFLFSLFSSSLFIFFFFFFISWSHLNPRTFRGLCWGGRVLGVLAESYIHNWSTSGEPFSLRLPATHRRENPFIVYFFNRTHPDSIKSPSN